jgi:hypothetical protein
MNKKSRLRGHRNTKKLSRRLQPVPRLIDNNQNVSDIAIHREILDNPEANRLSDEAAINLAVETGMSRKKAERLYGGTFDPKSLDKYGLQTKTGRRR